MILLQLVVQDYSHGWGGGERSRDLDEGEKICEREKDREVWFWYTRIVLLGAGGPYYARNKERNTRRDGRL